MAPKEIVLSENIAGFMMADLFGHDWLHDSYPSVQKARVEAVGLRMRVGEPTIQGGGGPDAVINQAADACRVDWTSTATEEVLRKLTENGQLWFSCRSSHAAAAGLTYLLVDRGLTSAPTGDVSPFGSGVMAPGMLQINDELINPGSCLYRLYTPGEAAPWVSPGGIARRAGGGEVRAEIWFNNREGLCLTGSPGGRSGEEETVRVKAGGTVCIAVHYGRSGRADAMTLHYFEPEVEPVIDKGVGSSGPTASVVCHFQRVATRPVLTSRDPKCGPGGTPGRESSDEYEREQALKEAQEESIARDVEGVDAARPPPAKGDVCPTLGLCRRGSAEGLNAFLLARGRELRLHIEQEGTTRHERWQSALVGLAASAATRPGSGEPGGIGGLALSPGERTIARRLRHELGVRAAYASLFAGISPLDPSSVNDQFIYACAAIDHGLKRLPQAPAAVVPAVLRVCAEQTQTLSNPADSPLAPLLVDDRGATIAGVIGAVASGVAAATPDTGRAGSGGCASGVGDLERTMCVLGGRARAGASGADQNEPRAEGGWLAGCSGAETALASIGRYTDEQGARVRALVPALLAGSHRGSKRKHADPDSEDAPPRKSGRVGAQATAQMDIDTTSAADTPMPDARDADAELARVDLRSLAAEVERAIKAEREYSDFLCRATDSRGGVDRCEWPSDVADLEAKYPGTDAFAAYRVSEGPRAWMDTVGRALDKTFSAHPALVLGQRQALGYATAVASIRAATSRFSGSLVSAAGDGLAAEIAETDADYLRSPVSILSGYGGQGGEGCAVGGAGWSCAVDRWMGDIATVSAVQAGLDGGAASDMDYVGYRAVLALVKRTFGANTEALDAWLELWTDAPGAVTDMRSAAWRSVLDCGGMLVALADSLRSDPARGLITVALTAFAGAEAATLREGGRGTVPVLPGTADPGPSPWDAPVASVAGETRVQLTPPEVVAHTPVCRAWAHVGPRQRIHGSTGCPGRRWRRRRVLLGAGSARTTPGSWATTRYPTPRWALSGTGVIRTTASSVEPCSAA